MSDPRRRLSRPRRDGAVVAVLAFAGLTASFMQTIVIPIQGELPALLDAPAEDTAWVITVTLLSAAIATPISGKLGDMYGKRRIALCMLALLVAGSVVAALSPSVVPLIVGRALQGMGAGVIPLGISILRDVLHRDRLGSAIALVSATLGVGGALGLPVSALITERYDWHLLFWIAGALGATCFALVLWIVPVSTLRSGGRFDWPGAAGLAVGLVGVLLAISRGNEWGWSSPGTLTLLLGGVVVLLGWGWMQLRTPNALVDLRVSARAPVLLTNLASVGMGFALFASNIVYPQLLELPPAAGGLGLPLLPASLVLMPAGLAMLAMSPLAGRIERTAGPKPLLVAGSVIIALTYLVSVFLELEVWHVLVINIVIGIGIGLGYAAMPALIMRAVPASETGAANGLNALMRSLGTTTAAAAVAATLSSSAVQVGDALAPSDEGYRAAFLFGLVAAALCAILAALIPKPRPVPGEHPAVPEGRI
ncbi:MFS transporter [Naasia sp. SYSU D00948]|uniref:MFS transporter n=1 Tax=Naasia sp. SYSU D00948 TaxID=2817379 RepID=UPI001B303502|nr:MFS transporter [Naasia sp. SYSU D00948]